jgi:MraZ protein
MDRFVSTFTNKIDAKGRVSIPAPFRAVLERDGYAGGIYCYPSLDAPALDAGGQSLAQKIDGLLAGLPDYSDERDELSVALYGDVQILSLDGDGRIVLPEALRAHAGLATHVTFVGLGQKFRCGNRSASKRGARGPAQRCKTTAASSARGAASGRGTTAAREEHGNDGAGRHLVGGGCSQRDIAPRSRAASRSPTRPATPGRRNLH